MLLLLLDSGSKIKWLGHSKKVFQDSHYDIVTSMHHQKGFKKSPKGNMIRRF